MDSKVIRYAVVGLGHIAQNAILPAFKHVQSNSKLTALISDDAVKRKKLAKMYNVPNTYSYDQYEECLTSGLVDCVFIALPNHLHCDYTVRAANQGIHVLCEKPMALSDDECEKMIDSAESNQVKLMIAYRLHFEPTNLTAIDLITKKKIGDPRIFNSVFTMQVKAGNIRVDGDRGGGTAWDIGVYCINAARYLFKSEPLEVIAYAANNGERRFDEVEEMLSATLRFPKERLAAFTCSFGAFDNASFDVVGTKGKIRLDPAYEYQEKLAYSLVTESGKKSKTNPKQDQFGAEIAYFSDCILKNKNPEPSGYDGWADVRIIRALYESARNKSSVRINPLLKRRRPAKNQEIKLPPVSKKPEIVHADSPHP